MLCSGSVLGEVGMDAGVRNKWAGVFGKKSVKYSFVLLCVGVFFADADFDSTRIRNP